MKKTMTFLLIGILTCLLIFIIYTKNERSLPSNDHSSAAILPTEQFIKDYLIAKDGTIRTNFAEKERGEERLSESIGLWLEYLVAKQDLEEFRKTIQVIEDNFLLPNHTIAWEIQDGERATTNALIDDLRIIEALFREGERSDEPYFINLAKNISEAILQYNRKEDHFVDFYDTTYNYANDSLTLSYVNPEAFRYMVSYGLLSTESLNELFTFMEKIPLDNGFYPKTYHTSEQVFYYDETINLIDQLYTVIYLERAGINTVEFFNWLKETFYEDDILYGRYDRQTKEPAVQYEAASVYALTIIYSVEKQDDTFASDLYKQMMNLKIQDNDHAYYGGYVELDTTNTHSFDNLLPLIAERILHVEEIINEQ